MIAWLVASACCTPASAHHSIAATYLTDQQRTIKGVIVKLLFRNPHSFIYVDAVDEKGVMQDWAVECAGLAAMARDHITATTLKPGDHVIVTGLPGRNPADHRLLLMSLERPADGLKYKRWSG